MSTPLDRFTHRPERTESVTFALDPNDSERLREARSAAAKARAASDGKPDDEELCLAAIEAEDALSTIEASIVTIRFDLRAVGPTRVEELMLAHPASKEAKAKARAANNGNPAAEPACDDEAMAPALLAEAITAITTSDQPDDVQTVVTVEQMRAMWASKSLSVPDRSTLYNTAVLLNQASSSVGDLGKG